jgi:Domain of unknown function (DU1801)
MTNVNVQGIENEKVREIFLGYPEPVRQKLMLLRRLVLQTASETEGVGSLEETLKWNQPAYLAKGGSTVRMGWSESDPVQYALYFHCQTSLVDTFRELYGDVLTFKGNRAIVFSQDDDLPSAALKHCISLALTYHHRKHLPLLGASPGGYVRAL